MGFCARCGRQLYDATCSVCGGEVANKKEILNSMASIDDLHASGGDRTPGVILSKSSTYSTDPHSDTGYSKAADDKLNGMMIFSLLTGILCCNVTAAISLLLIYFAKGAPPEVANSKLNIALVINIIGILFAIVGTFLKYSNILLQGQAGN